MNLLLAKVVKRKGRWYVESESGKNLGKKEGYETKKEAVNRLQQVEYHKNAKSGMDENKIKLFSTAAKIIDLEEESPVRDQLVKANKIEKPNEDLLYMRFILCHEGVNANKDGFTLAELQSNFETAKNKDINIEHSNNIVGVITASRLIESAEDASFEQMTKADEFVPYIECDAVVYQYKFPDVAATIRERHSLGNLTFSMETWYKAGRCEKCDTAFARESEYCDHLTNRFAQGSEDARWLVGITFGGAGIVQKPADKDAKGLVIAKLEDWDVEWISERMDFDDLENLIDAFVMRLRQDDIIDKEKLKDKLESLLNKIATLTVAKTNNAKGELSMYNFESKEELLKSDMFKTALAEAVQAELDKVDVDEKLTQANERITQLEADVEAKDAKIAEAETKAEKAEKDFTDYKEAQAQKDLGNKRYTELSKAGVKFPEDIDVEKVKAGLGAKSEEDYAEHKAMLLANVTKEQASEGEEAEENVENLSTAREDLQIAVASSSDIEKLADSVFGDKQE